MLKHRNRIALDSQSGKAIGDHDGKIARTGVQLSNRAGMERPSKIGPPKIAGPVERIGPKLEHRNSSFGGHRKFVLQPLSKSGKIKHRMHRIASPRMVKLKVKHLTRRKAISDSRQ
jgi:hypothetical protein